MKAIDKKDKNLTKLKNQISKICNENTTQKFIFMIENNGFLESLIFCLKVEDFKFFRIITNASFKIAYYNGLLRNNMASLIMSSLHSSKSMRCVLELETEIQPIPEQGRLNEQMVICIFRHIIYFPQNREYCLNLIRGYKNFVECMIQRPFCYVNDIVDIIQDLMIKDDNIKRFIFNNSIECGSMKILHKALKYYKIEPMIYSTLSIPVMLENRKDFDISDINNKDYLIAESCMNSKWEYLPYIFETFKIESDDWFQFKIPIMEGTLTLPFIQTLFHCMEKYDYDFELLLDGNKNKQRIFCNDNIRDEFIKRGLGEKFNFCNNAVHNRTLNCSISNLFDCYRTGNIDLLKSHLFLSYAYANQRFLKEKKYTLDLFQSGVLGWCDKLTRVYEQFDIFCSDFCHKLHLCDALVLEYNSTITISLLYSPLINIRFYNRLVNIMNMISDDFLFNEYKTIIDNIKKDYYETLKLVRKELSIDLNVETPYVVSDEKNLEEQFLNLYQNSYHKYIENENLVRLEIIEQLKNRKMNYIAKEVEYAISVLVPIEEIIRILNIKGITFDLSKFKM